MFVSRPVLFAVSCCYLFNASTVHAQLNLSNIIGEKTKNLTQQAPAKAVPSAPAAPKSTTNAVNALTNTSNTSADASVLQKVTGVTKATGTNPTTALTSNANTGALNALKSQLAGKDNAISGLSSQLQSAQTENSQLMELPLIVLLLL